MTTDRKTETHAQSKCVIQVDITQQSMKNITKSTQRKKETKKEIEDKKLDNLKKTERTST